MSEDGPKKPENKGLSRRGFLAGVGVSIVGPKIPVSLPEAFSHTDLVPLVGEFSSFANVQNIIALFNRKPDSELSAKEIIVLNDFLKHLFKLPDGLPLSHITPESLSKAESHKIDEVAQFLAKHGLASSEGKIAILKEQSLSRIGYEAASSWLSNSSRLRGQKVADLKKQLKDTFLLLIRNLNKSLEGLHSLRDFEEGSGLFRELSEIANQFGDKELSKEYENLRDVCNSEVKKLRSEIKAKKISIAQTAEFAQGSIEGDYNSFFFTLPKDISNVRDFIRNFIVNKLGENIQDGVWNVERDTTDNNRFKLTINNAELLDKFKKEFANQIK